MRIKIDTKFINKLEESIKKNFLSYKFTDRVLLANVITECIRDYALKCEVSHERKFLPAASEPSSITKEQKYRNYESEIGLVFTSIVSEIGSVKDIKLEGFIKKNQDAYFIDKEQIEREVQTLFILIAIKKDLESQGGSFEDWLKTIFDTQFPPATQEEPSLEQVAVDEVYYESSSRPYYTHDDSGSMQPAVYTQYYAYTPLPVPQYGMPYFSSMQSDHLFVQQALCDITGLQAEISNLKKQVTQLEEKKWQLDCKINPLKSQKTILEQEIAALTQQRDELREGNRILIEELPLLPGASASSSFSTAQPFVKLKTKSFEQIILETLVAETSEPLPRIRGKIDPSENRVEYYKQFLPFILAEIKEEVNKQEKTIQEKRLDPFIAEYKRGAPSNSQKDAITRIRASLKQKNLPKLDHGFFKELVKIIFTEESRSHKSSSSKEKHDKLCVYAVASARSHSEDDENENKDAEKVIDLEITLSAQDLELINQKNVTSFKIHWLAGLIPTERMYLACLHMQRPSFEHQFIHADLLEWPDIDRSIVSVNAVQTLNSSQRDCVMKLASATHGLYLLQGPPGTGKTTTAAALIVQLAKHYPEKSLMVCAPSNQALRELLRRVHALAPDILMALIGVEKDLPEAFNEIYVHKFTKTLYQPLISLKKALKETSITEEMKIEALAACRKVSEKISAFLDQPTLFECKFETKQTLSILSKELSEMCDDLESSSINLIELLERHITEIQNTSYVFEEYLIQRAQIVFATLVASGRPWLQKQRGSFDILIVDEAAQALLPEVIIPHKFNPTLCVQIGDPQQLAPTITLMKAQENGYADSMMYKLMLDYQQPHEMLRIQYRMHEQICRWISRQFYEGLLETDPGVSARESILTTNSHLDARLKRPSLFFDIRTGSRARETSASSRNPVEANAVVTLACYLLFTCHFLPEDIGIITFYAAQVALIRDLFEKALNAFRMPRDQTNAIRKKLLIHTVDGFQGGERKVTLVSVVQASKSVGFLNNSRRLNVGMSRAQEARWIFGKFAPLSKSNSVLPSLLTELRQDGLIVKEEELSGICNSSFRK